VVKGKCKRITANQPSQGCPAGTKPVPETDNCVPITSGSKSGCSKGQIKVDGKCMTKNQAVGFCGPGFHAQGGKCLPGFVLPQALGRRRMAARRAWPGAKRKAVTRTIDASEPCPEHWQSENGPRTSISWAVSNSSDCGRLAAEVAPALLAHVDAIELRRRLAIG
jgi:hypothetical protein